MSYKKIIVIILATSSIFFILSLIFPRDPYKNKRVRIVPINHHEKKNNNHHFFYILLLLLSLFLIYLYRRLFAPLPKKVEEPHENSFQEAEEPFNDALQVIKHQVVHNNQLIRNDVRQSNKITVSHERLAMVNQLHEGQTVTFNWEESYHRRNNRLYCENIKRVNIFDHQNLDEESRQLLENYLRQTVSCWFDYLQLYIQIVNFSFIFANYEKKKNNHFFGFAFGFFHQKNLSQQQKNIFSSITVLLKKIIKQLLPLEKEVVDRIKISISDNQSFYNDLYNQVQQVQVPLLLTNNQEHHQQQIIRQQQKNAIFQQWPTLYQHLYNHTEPIHSFLQQEGFFVIDDQKEDNFSLSDYPTFQQYASEEEKKIFQQGDTFFKKLAQTVVVPLAQNKV